MHFLGDHVRSIGAEHPEAAADDIDDGQIWHRVSVGQTATLEIPGPAPLEPLLELVKQARLANARLAQDSHDLPTPFLGPGQQVMQRRQITLPTDEAAQCAAAHFEAAPLMPDDSVRLPRRPGPGSRRAELEAPLQEAGSGPVH